MPALTAGVTAAALAVPLTAAPAFAASGELRTVQGSLRTADGVPYAGIEWVATASDGSLTDSGRSDAQGQVSLLAPTDVSVKIRLYAYGTRLHSSDAGEADVLLSPTDTQVNIVTQAAHNITVVTTDKYLEPVRNAQVAPLDVLVRFPLLDGFGAATHISGFLPGRRGGPTDSSGRYVLATPGLWEPSKPFAEVSASIRPGTVQRTEIRPESIEGRDPQNRVALAVLPYAPIMIDASAPKAAAADDGVAAQSADTPTGNPTVKVTSPDGAPLTSAQVSLVRVRDGDTETQPKESAPVRSATTDDSGIAAFGAGLPAGNYRAVPNNVSARTVDFTVTAASRPTKPQTSAQPTVKVKALKKDRLQVKVSERVKRKHLHNSFEKVTGPWKVTVLTKSKGKWTTVKSIRTNRAGKKVIDLPKGRYRVTVQGNKSASSANSNAIALKR